MARKIFFSLCAFCAALLIIQSAHSAKQTLNEVVVTMLDGSAKLKATGAKADIPLKQGGPAVR